MKRLLAVSSSSFSWSTESLAALRFLLFVALLLLPGSVIVLPLLWWIRHKAAQTPGAQV